MQARRFCQKIILCIACAIFTSLVIVNGLVHAETPASTENIINPTAVVNIPPLNNDVATLQFLLGIREDAPTVLSDTINYNVDIFKIAKEQESLVHQLSQDPRYLTAFKNRNPYLNIWATTNSTSEQREARVSDQAIDAWKKSIRNTIHTLPKEAAPLSALLSLLQQTKQQLQGATAEGLLTGLVLSITQEKEKAELRKKIFSAPEWPQKIQLLAEHLPDHIPREFQGIHAGIKAGSDKMSALTTLQKLATAEQQLQTLLHAYAIIHHSKAQNIKTAEDYVSGLQRNNFEFYRDIDTMKEEIKSLPPELGKQSSLAKIAQKEALQYADQIETVTTVNHGERLLLKEVPPRVGIFRGCVGSDCSTSNSFPFPNDPNERVFFIIDHRNKTTGYVSGTIVLAEGKKSFFAHTIQGSHVSGPQTEVILHALEKAKATIGVEQIILPKSVTEMINFTPIREVINNYANADGVKKVSIQYQNIPLRQMIENFKSDHNSGRYDKISNNTSGVLFLPNDRFMQSLEVKTGVQTISPAKMPPLLLEDALDFSLDLLYANRSDAKERILKAVGYDPKVLDPVQEILSNPQKLSIAEIDKKLSALSSSLPLSPHWYEKKAYLLVNAYINATDGFSENQIEKTATLLLTELLKNGGEALNTHSIAAVKQNGKAIQSSAAYIDFTKKILKALEHPDHEHRRDVIEPLLSFSLHDKNFDAAIAKELLQPKSPLHAIALTYLSKQEAISVEAQELLASLLASRDTAQLAAQLEVSRLLQKKYSVTNKAAQDFEQYLNELLRSNNPDILHTIVQPLAKSKNFHLDNYFVTLLSKMLLTADASIANEVADILSIQQSKFGEEIVHNIISSLDRHKTLKIKLMGLLCSTHTDASSANITLAKLLGDSNPLIVEAALQYLERNDPTQIQGTIIAHLNSSSPQTRKAAAQYIFSNEKISADPQIAKAIEAHAKALASQLPSKRAGDWLNIIGELKKINVPFVDELLVKEALRDNRLNASIIGSALKEKAAHSDTIFSLITREIKSQLTQRKIDPASYSALAANIESLLVAFLAENKKANMSSLELQSLKDIMQNLRKPNAISCESQFLSLKF